jgi:hypothetical protein
MKVVDVEAIVAALNAADVRYIVVGGLAVVGHGYLRYTQDVDLVIDLEEINAVRAMRALSGLGYRPRVPVEIEAFAQADIRQSWIEEKGMIVFQLFNEERLETNIDVFVFDPFPFGEAYRRASRWEVNTDLVAPILDLDRLIAMKEAAARPKDLGDAGELHKIRSLLARPSSEAP